MSGERSDPLTPQEDRSTHPFVSPPVRHPSTSEHMGRSILVGWTGAALPSTPPGRCSVPPVHPTRSTLPVRHPTRRPVHPPVRQSRGTLVGWTGAALPSTPPGRCSVPPVHPTRSTLPVRHPTRRPVHPPVRQSRGILVGWTGAALPSTHPFGSLRFPSTPRQLVMITSPGNIQNTTIIRTRPT